MAYFQNLVWYVHVLCYAMYSTKNIFQTQQNNIPSQQCRSKVLNIVSGIHCKKFLDFIKLENIVHN